jgi:hypothetical protein
VLGNVENPRAVSTLRDHRTKQRLRVGSITRDGAHNKQCFV